VNRRQAREGPLGERVRVRGSEKLTLGILCFLIPAFSRREKGLQAFTTPSIRRKDGQSAAIED
jgi:hypothetical protein